MFVYVLKIIVSGESQRGREMLEKTMTERKTIPAITNREIFLKLDTFTDSLYGV